ncbi:MAG: hypothetical protein OHK0039_47700 [Bacteroidia bacterium]
MHTNRRKQVLHYTLVLLVFAVTGSTAALLPKYFMPYTDLRPGSFLYVVAYIVLITPIYQVLLLGYAFLFGKFRYFYDKQRLLFRRIAGLFRCSKPTPPDNPAPPAP